MAPEQARGEWDDVDARCDIWSVGASMFALLTGREPHEGRTQQEVLIMSMMRAPEPIRDIEPGLPANVAAIVDKALAFHPKDRFDDALDMQRAVRAALAELPEVSAADLLAARTLDPVTTDARPLSKARPSSPPPRRRSSGWRQAIVAAACCASIAAVASDINERGASFSEWASRLTLKELAATIEALGEQAGAAARLPEAPLLPPAGPADEAGIEVDVQIGAPPSEESFRSPPAGPAPVIDLDN
jgi:serine/threonine protein kinase